MDNDEIISKIKNMYIMLLYAITKEDINRVRQYLSDDEHWLRLRYFPPTTVVKVNYNALWVDYIELVPLHIVSDPNKPEDRH